MDDTATPCAGVMDSAGSQLVSLMANHCLFGLFVAQTFAYHTNFPNDRGANKLLVQVVVILETVQIIILTYDWYTTFVLRFGDPHDIWAIRTTWLTIPVLSGIIGFIVQVFYADRIYKISKSKGLSALILLLSVVQLVASLASGAILHQSTYFYQLKSKKTLILSSIWLLSTVICDILIAVSMTRLLLRFRRDFHAAPSGISKLISLTVETGTLTASVACITGIWFLARPGSQWVNVPGYVFGKLYTNSLMRILNNRVKVGNGYSEPFLTTAPELTALSNLSGQDSIDSQQSSSREGRIPGDSNPDHLEKGTA